MAQRIGESSTLCRVLLTSGILALNLGELQLAQTYAARAYGLASTSNAGLEAMNAAYLLAVCRLQQGDLLEAHRITSAALECSLSNIPLFDARLTAVAL